MSYKSFFFSSRRRHTRWPRDWSSDVCSSDLVDRRAHDVRGFVGCQEDVGGSELGGLAGTAEPGVFAEVREFLRELAVRGLERGPDRAGSHGDHADPLLRDLGGYLLGEVIDRRLGGAVI